MEIYHDRENAELTSAELSNVWSAYMENSMTKGMYQYFQNTAEDKDIKKIAVDILNNSQSNLEDLKEFFKKEKIETPYGFNEDDVKVGVPKLYSDIFILYFCDEIIKLRMNVYPIALNDSARNDVREFFSKNIDTAKSIQNELVDLMHLKGVYIRPPQVVTEKKASFIENKSYTKGLFENTRPLNVAEITSINKLLQRAAFSKMMLLSFAQTASEEDVSRLFLKGKEIAQSIVDDTRSILEEEDIPAPANWDFKYSESADGPFSDRLMLFFLLTCTGVLCFYNAAQGITASLRTDISAKFAKFEATMVSYFSSGAKLMMEKGYFERPLQIVDRNRIRNT